MSDNLAQLSEPMTLMRTKDVKHLADRIEELEAKAMKVSNAALLEKRRADKAEAKLAKAVEALSGVMVGGNHLALLLPDNFLPAETEPLDALDMMGAGDAYEVWCCWRSIMLARTTLAELTGGDNGQDS